MQNWEEVQLAVAALRQRLGAALPSRPDAAIILGTGLSGLVERMEDTVSVPYADLPGFPVSTVASHAGAFVLGRLGGRTVLVQQGRCHLYEGFGPDKVCMGVRVMAGLGADTLILTNAAGALDPQFDAGGLMCISDQINFTGVSPLSGPNHEAWGERFPDMSAIYDAGLRDLACRCALELGIRLERGVYIGVRGPQMESPAETRMFRQWGADAVGMSTVPEAIAASHCGLPVVALSLITNMAAGMAGKRLDGAEVIEIADQRGPVFQKLVKGIVEVL